LIDTAGNVNVLCTVGAVRGVTQLSGTVFIVCGDSSSILRFDATTHQRLTDIDVKGLRLPLDLAACEQTSQLYAADSQCVWRVSTDGTDIRRWLPKSPSGTFRPSRLSVTSDRLLVTSTRIHQLILFDADGDELRRVRLADDLEPQHAAESPSGTFIVSLKALDRLRLSHGQVAEVSTAGEVLRQFSGSRLTPLGFTSRVAVDSRGNVFLTEYYNSRILLLDSGLSLRRVVIDKHQLNYKPPRRLCYCEQSGQLMFALHNDDVAVFDVLRPVRSS